MEAKQNAWRSFGIANQEAGEPLSVQGVVRNPPRLGDRFQQSRWLKQDPLLRPPEQNKGARQ